MTAIGVTDAVMHPNHISFLRFEYPSRLPEGPRRAMADVAARLMPALGFDNSMFNIEFFVQPDGRLTIVECNGRMASQFAPLVHAVHGISSYEIQLDLCTGRTPQLPPARDDLVTASFLLRTYEDAIVRSVPDPSIVLERFPHAHVEVLVRPGHRLSENDDDTASHRLAVVALAAPDRASLLGRFAEAPCGCSRSSSTRSQPPCVNNRGQAPFIQGGAWAGGPGRSRPRRRGPRP